MLTPAQITTIKEKIATLEAELLAFFQSTMTPEQIRINDVLLDWIGKRCTLNPQIPPDVSCAEAVSFILKQIDIIDGTLGIAGTASLLTWVEVHTSIFTEIFEPEESALLISASGTGNGLVEGHTGWYLEFNKKYINDWTIASNNSQTGLLDTQWSGNGWTRNYTQLGGIKPRIFRVIG